MCAHSLGFVQLAQLAKRDFPRQQLITKNASAVASVWQRAPIKRFLLNKLLGMFLGNLVKNKALTALFFIFSWLKFTI